MTKIDILIFLRGLKGLLAKFLKDIIFLLTLRSMLGFMPKLVKSGVLMCIYA